VSGGALECFYSHLEDHVGEFKDRELDNLVQDLAKLFHDREWYLSGDTCEGDWRESRDAFKAKWFTRAGRQKRVEKYLDDLKAEVLDSLGLDQRKCQTCKHWTPEGEKYGCCEYTTEYLNHRADKCKRWEVLG